jgi:hypothetical protein
LESDPRKAIILSFILTIVLMATSFAWIARQVDTYQAFQMDRDEAVHANRGLDIASAIIRGSPSDLWQETIKPDWYPPGYGYLEGAWFLLVGPSMITARVYAALCYFLLGLLLWGCAKQVFPKAHPIFFLIPALFLISDTQHLLFSSLSMQDIPANLMVFASLYFLNESLKEPTVKNTLLTSLFALLCFFTRYGQGIMLFVALAIIYLLFIRRLWAYIPKIAAAWLPAVAILFLWLVVLGQWKWVLVYANVQPGEGVAWSLSSLSFYLHQLGSESSGWLPILVICLWSFLQIRKQEFSRAAIPYLVFMIPALVVLSYRSNYTARFGTVLFPPLWILSSGGSAGLLSLVGKRGIRYALTSIWILILLFLGLKNHRSLPVELQIAYENTNTGVNDAYQFISETLDIPHQQNLNLVMYGDTDHWSAFALHFYLQSQCFRNRPSCAIQVTDERGMNKGWPPQNSPPEVRVKRVEAALNSADALVLFAKTPVVPEGWTEVARQGFLFARYKVEPKVFQVVILRRK